MSVEDLKNLLLGAQEAVLELVQQDDGTLILRPAGSDKAPLVKIEFNEEIRSLLGESTAIVAQHMVQAAFFALMEQQVSKWQAQVIDQKPHFYS
jgi:hypothetical protein